jgi:predicted RNA binding protein YcfA (HicA-like mRNA interferase family)
MGKRRYPPLSPTEVINIVQALGFSLKRQTGSHQHYEGIAQDGTTRAIVTIDCSVDEFWEELMKSMIRQSGWTRERFYGATKKTAKKI